MARTTGSGSFIFRHRPIDLPESMQRHLLDAHSAFAPDREDEGGDGSTWFTLNGVGLLRLDPGLTRIETIGGDPELAQTNIHGASLLRRAGETFLALPADDAETVWITDTRGRIIRTFANPYGAGGPPFNVCDVAYVDGLLFAANGYADNVCFTCDPFRGTPGDASVGAWESFRFGGTGPEHGRFGTAHGVTRVPGTNVLTVADRANSRLETYTPAGHYVGGLALPAGSLPCSVDYYERFALVACLMGPGESTPAPIYVFEDGNLVSELHIARDLGLDGFTHIHNAAFRAIKTGDGGTTLFVVAYGWNPGGFAVLEPVS